MSDTVDSILQHKGRHVWSISPRESVLQAISLMADKGIGALVVISDETLVGIISERDYTRKVILQGRSSKDTLVREIMTRSVITVSRDHSVDECMRIMTEHRIRHLPVLEGATIVGVVSIGDLVKAIISEQAPPIGQLHTC